MEWDDSIFHAFRVALAWAVSIWLLHALDTDGGPGSFAWRKFPVHSWSCVVTATILVSHGYCVVLSDLCAGIPVSDVVVETVGDGLARWVYLAMALPGGIFTVWSAMSFGSRLSALNSRYDHG